MSKSSGKRRRIEVDPPPCTDNVFSYLVLEENGDDQLAEDGMVLEVAPFDATLLVAHSQEDLIHRRAQIMRLLVEQGNIPHLQLLSQSAVERLIASKTASWSTLLRRCLTLFTTFCDERGLPVYPITATKTALWLMRADLPPNDEEGSEEAQQQEGHEGSSTTDDGDTCSLSSFASSSSSRNGDEDDDDDAEVSTPRAGEYDRGSTPTAKSIKQAKASSLFPQTSQGKVKKKKKALSRKTLEQYITRLTTIRNATIPFWKSRLGADAAASVLGSSPVVKNILQRTGEEGQSEVKKRAKALRESIKAKKRDGIVEEVEGERIDPEENIIVDMEPKKKKHAPARKATTSSSTKTKLGSAPSPPPPSVPTPAPTATIASTSIMTEEDIWMSNILPSNDLYTVDSSSTLLPPSLFTVSSGSDVFSVQTLLPFSLSLTSPDPFPIPPLPSLTPNSFAINPYNPTPFLTTSSSAYRQYPAASSSSSCHASMSSLPSTPAIFTLNPEAYRDALAYIKILASEGATTRGRETELMDDEEMVAGLKKLFEE